MYYCLHVGSVSYLPIIIPIIAIAIAIDIAAVTASQDDQQEEGGDPDDSHLCLSQPHRLSLTPPSTVRAIRIPRRGEVQRL